MVKLFGSTVVSTWVEPTVVVGGSILPAVKGTGSVLVKAILDPIVILFDGISAISNDVAALPAALIWLGPVAVIASG